MSYERFAARGSDHVVEGKQADQEDGSERKSAIRLYMHAYIARVQISDEIALYCETKIDVVLKRKAMSFKCGGKQTL